MEGLIRKIVIGKEPKNGMAYYVGMRAGGGEVEASCMTKSSCTGTEKIAILCT